MSDHDIRPATREDLRWLHQEPDQEKISEMTEAEIAEARTATPTPRHWQPVEVEEVLLR